MVRKTFLKNLLAVSSIGILPDLPLKHYHKLYLLQCFVAGFKFYDGPTLLSNMQEGDQLELVREPNNKYDECAIALHWNNRKIGFIPATENELLSRLIDGQALDLIAEITHLNSQAPTWETMSISISFLKSMPNAEVPKDMKYLSCLETPQYISFSRKDGVISRMEWEEDN